MMFKKSSLKNSHNELESPQQAFPALPNIYQ
jgi:hypothetical protein